MELTLLDPRLKEALGEIVTAEHPHSLYRPECTLLNANAGIELKVRLFSMTVIQDFVNNYQDIIQIEVEMFPADYRNVIAHIQDLECSLVLYPCEPDTGTDIYDDDPIIIQDGVFTEDQTDFDKQFQSNAMGDNKDDGTTLSASQAQAYGRFKFHLMSKEMRDIRKVQINMIGRETTLEPVLHWACQQFKVDSTIILPVDNTSTIDNFIIPPMKNIGTLFPYLQQRYGIYKKGLGYYYTDNTLYMYPLYDTDVSTSPYQDGVVHLVNGVQTYFSMVNFFHKWDDQDLYIAATHYLEVHPMDTAASENKGDNIVTTNADTVLDRLAPVQGDGKVEVADNQTVIKRQNSAGNMSSDSQSVVYQDVTSNIYQTTTELARDDGSSLATIWGNAEPFSIKPAQHLVYTYSTNDGDFKTSEGKILGVMYQTVPLGINTTNTIIRFNAYIKAFIEAEKKEGDEYQYKDS